MQYSKITSWLWLLGNLRPEMWDWIVPMGACAIPSASKVGIALILKSLGQSDPIIRKSVPGSIAVEKKLFAEGIEGLNYMTNRISALFFEDTLPSSAPILVLIPADHPPAAVRARDPNPGGLSQGS